MRKTASEWTLTTMLRMLPVAGGGARGGAGPPSPLPHPSRRIMSRMVSDVLPIMHLGLDLFHFFFNSFYFFCRVVVFPASLK